MPFCNSQTPQFLNSEFSLQLSTSALPLATLIRLSILWSLTKGGFVPRRPCGLLWLASFGGPGILSSKLLDDRACDVGRREALFEQPIDDSGFLRERSALQC